MCVKQINTIQESDDFSIHNIVIRNVISERSMDNQGFDRLTAEENEMTIVLEFPKNPSNSDSVTQEIRDILKSLLWEYLDKVS